MKKILLALTGSIACVKAFDIIKNLKNKGFEVQVIVTTGGEAFSSRLALEAISGFPVLGPEIFSFKKTNEYSDPFQKNTTEIFAHLELSTHSTALVIAPCSANFLEKIYSGRADDFLSTALLAYTQPVIIAPAMNTHMWNNERVQKALQKIGDQKNYTLVSPQKSGVLACGEEGAGKMATVEVLVQEIERSVFACKYPCVSQKFSQKNILMTIGGTQEFLDPVRYIGNASTGKTGKIFAEKWREMGAKNISVLHGNISVKLSPDIFDLQKSSTASEMLEKMKQLFFENDIIVFAAAVSDFVPDTYSDQKIKKSFSGEESFSLDLKNNIDIAYYFAQKKRAHQVFIGFALETGTEEWIKKSLRKKASMKKFDIIFGNTPENLGTENGDFLVYVTEKDAFHYFSGEKSQIFEDVLKVFF